MDRWHWMMIGACFTFAAMLALTGCITVHKPVSIYSQISIISLPVHTEDEE